MNFFERWIVNKARKIHEKNNAIEEDCLIPSTRRAVRVGSDLSDNRPMTFNIYRASGGSIVELRKYDERRDQWNNNLHVIPDDADFTENLSKIITLETLRA